MKELTTQEAFNKAAACCSGAEYCLSDIQKKLDKWGLGAAQQKEVLTRLQAEKFIDEARFSRCFVRDKFRYNQWGRIKIMQAFRLKNIPDTCCREALTEIEEEEYLCVLRKLLQSKARSVKAASDYERNGKLIRFIRIMTNNLSGVPSVVFGLFGMSLFVSTLGWGDSIIAGSFTLALMSLPLIIRTTEEALKSIDDSFRHGSLALGATKLQTIRRVVLPMAFPNIIT